LGRFHGLDFQADFCSFAAAVPNFIWECLPIFRVISLVEINHFLNQWQYNTSALKIKKIKWVTRQINFKKPASEKNE